MCSCSASRVLDAYNWTLSMKNMSAKHLNEFWRSGKTPVDGRCGNKEWRPQGPKLKIVIELARFVLRTTVKNQECKILINFNVIRKKKRAKKNRILTFIMMTNGFIHFFF